MEKKLLIVESPAKISTLEKYLDSSYAIVATYGHIRNMPKDVNSVDIKNNFAMNLQISQDKIRTVQEIIKKAISSDIIYLATDFDREGEGIAWHVLEILKPHLKNQKIHRITFNEITKQAVLHAIEHPRSLDMNLVNAYKSRCILDFLVGFHLSPVLWNKVGGEVKSAGRVQSPALKLLKERQDLIKQFVAEEYWHFDIKTDIGPITLKETHGIKCDKMTFKSKEEADKIVDIIKDECSQLIVTDIKKQTRYLAPPTPFTTATLQQEAASSFGISLDKIMHIAQNLYEGVKIQGESVALITYMRTDSTTLSEESLLNIKEYVVNNFGASNSFVNVKKTKSKTAQEAHEAIRPTNVCFTPELLKDFLDKDQMKLYGLIWRKTVASQMIKAKTSITTVTLASPNKKNIFTCSVTIIEDLGWKAVYNSAVGKNDKEDLLSLKIGQIINLKDIKDEQKFTSPPSHYSNSSLVKELDALGIGRPSTYAYIVTTLTNRAYIDDKNRSFNITHTGSILVEFLSKYFSDYIDYEFTAKMEKDLDKIALGKLKIDQFLQNFWNKLNTNILDINAKDIKKGSISIPIEEHCPTCNKNLEARQGRYGEFICCSGYPTCKYIKKSTTIILLDKSCPLCSGQLRSIEGKNYKLIGCINFPKCKYTADNDPKNENIICPKCKTNKIVQKRKSSKQSLYGCSGYPDCNNVYNFKPLYKQCNKCESEIMLQETPDTLICPICKAKIEVAIS